MPLINPISIGHIHQLVSELKNGFMSSSDKIKLDSIAANANNYVHPTSAGYKHIPSGGKINQILEYSANGAAKWVDNHSRKYTTFVIGTSNYESRDVDYRCDGVNDEAEIMAAFRALPAEGGEIVLLNGQYNIGNSIALQLPSTMKKFSLKGMGETRIYRNFNVALNVSSANSPTISVTSVSESCIVEFENLHIIADALPDRSKYAGSIAIHPECSYVMVHKCFMEKHTFGVYQENPVAYNKKFTVVTKCTVTGTELRGIIIANGIVAESKFYNNGYGVDIRDTFGIVVNSYFHDNLTGVYNALLNPGSFGTIIAGNVFSNNGRYGISGGKNTIAIENLFTNNTTAGFNSLENCIVSNNIFFNEKALGISLDGDNSLVANNVFRDCKSGIELKCNKSLITDNHIKNNTGYTSTQNAIKIYSSNSNSYIINNLIDKAILDQGTSNTKINNYMI